MSTIPDHYPITFDSQMRAKFQQMRSRIERCIGQVHDINPEGKRFHISKESASKAYTRGWIDATPSQPDRTERWLRSQEFNPQEWIDRTDAKFLGVVGDPTPDRIKNLMAVAYRDKDQVIIDGLGGNAIEGKTGTTVVPYNPSYVVDKDTGGTDSGINLEKFLDVSAFLGASNVYGQDVENETSVAMICTHFEIKDMLKDDKFTNADYAILKRIESGRVENFQGVTIIPVSPQLLPIDDATSVRTTYMFTKDAIAFGQSSSVQANVDTIAHKNRAILLDLFYGWGFTRIHDKGVYKVESFRENKAKEQIYEVVA